MEAAMSWLAFSASVLTSLMVGVFLWAFLPRGVVLTKAERRVDPDGNSTPDSWILTNNSPVAIRMTKVHVISPNNFNPRTGHIEEMPLPVFGDPDSGAELELGDFTSEVARTDWERPWPRVEVAAGDTLTGRVPVNTSLKIAYRRAGWTGVLERRGLVIHGDV
jgi:hypothetical protein